MAISSAYFRYWGKAARDDPEESSEGKPKWHPLVYHALDVAACGQVLLRRQPAWLENLVRLSGLESAVLSPWLIFLLALHDLGKFGNGFQALRPDLKKTLQGSTKPMAYDVRHDTLGYAVLMEQLPAWFEAPELAQRGGNLLRLWAAAVAGHHGRPPKNDNRKAHVLKHLPADGPLRHAQEFVAAARGLLLPRDWQFPARTEESLDRYKRASWLVVGLAVTADWLGSNTEWFQYHEPKFSIEDYFNRIALPQAETAVAESGMCAPTPASNVDFAGLFPSIASPTPLQRWADEVVIEPGPQLFVLEELTGSGKTEAALTLAARLMQAGCGRGVYFALPTMATADAMFDRVRKGSEDGADEPWQGLFSAGEPSLVLAHSAAATRQKLDALQRRDSGYDEEREEASASQQSTAWLSDSRKKALLADFGIGTIDQALLAVMPLRHQSMRLLGVSTKVLLVDEVHACDCYMGELLSRLLRFHAALGGSAILLSATLPMEQRARLISAFADGAGFAADEPEKTDYPLATQVRASGLDEVPIEARATACRELTIEPLADEEAVLARLRATLDRGGCAVWVRNTVADAIDAWQAWGEYRPHNPATLFHARFALCDRLEIGDGVLKAFGPKSTPETRRGKLVIATQVVEQSLDVDFDDMVTDLAPIDLVVQRAGRLQRHRRDAQGRCADAEGRDGARLGVLMPAPTPDAGADWFKDLLPKAARVYADHGRLWLTAHWLTCRETRRLVLPQDARAMIESVYGPDAFEQIPAGLQKSSDSQEGACYSERSLADMNSLSFDQGYDPSGFEWPDEESDTDIPTRLGEKTVRLRLARIRGDALIPWASVHETLDWSLSELSVPRYRIAGESPRHAELIARAKELMPDQGRYRLIIPLEDAGTEFHGWALNEKDEEIRVLYSKIAGLSVE